MHIHRSNRVEALLTRLARLVAQPPSDPLKAECIVVQGRGMERWLSLELADRLGVFAAADFPFPRAFFQRILGEVLGDDSASGYEKGAEEAFEPAFMAWSIVERLPEYAGDPRFEPVMQYLDGETRGEKALQLARRIADTFDHYVVYRPDWVLAWERGERAPHADLPSRDEAWQSELWRALVARHGSHHLAGRLTRLVESLDASPPPGALPERISVFGLSALPELFLGALAALSRFTELHLFVLSPSSEYWGLIRSVREQARETAVEGAYEDPEALHLEEGHPLLASLGGVGRDFQNLLERVTDYAESDEDLYRDSLEGAPVPSLLAALQSDILHLRHRGVEPGQEPPFVVAASDRSIQVHSCHGPMREAQVLRDQLLDLFERDPSLEPRDVIVMAPKVETYAPFIEAAFGSEGGGPGLGHGAIPIRVADRGARSVYEVAEAFFRLLDLISGRLEANAVLDLLGTPCVRAKFGIGEEDEPALRRWVLEAGVRWGLDADHRAREGQPADDANTWRFGLDRLFLGHGMADREERLFAGVRPFDGLGGGDVVLLGRLADFIEVIERFHGRASTAMGLGEWQSLLAELLAAVIEADSETAHQRHGILDALGELVRAGELAGFSGRLSLPEVRNQLDAWVARKPPSGGFLSGGVTFCELVPMRTVPFRVVCLMGLGDTSFPRIRRPPGFDLIARSPRPGDRSSREDDRYLFLEALLSARDHFLVTYPGQSERDNESYPPSVVVGELLDHLDRAFVAEQEGVVTRERVVVSHRLQPFNPDYFTPDTDEPGLFSYSATAYAAACALGAGRSDPGVFVAGPLPDAEDADGPLALEELVLFLRNPARALLQGRLRLYLPSDPETQPDREPLDLSGLERWQVGEELVARLREGPLGDVDRQRTRGTGLLPLGELGDCIYEETEAEARRIAERFGALCGGESRPPLELDLALGDARLVGRLDGIWEGGRVRARFARLEEPWELDEWIRHLAFCAARPKDVPASTHLVGRSASKDKQIIQVSFGPVDDARERLEKLVGVYRRGQRSLMPFFPRTSRKYALTLRGDPAREETAIKNAYQFWRGDENEFAAENFGARPENADVYFEHAFGLQDPLAVSWRPDSDSDMDGFRSLARTVFQPLLQHRTEQ
ncbi:MAG: exodeoxyribonuclease V subunit gamma, partial [Myxococcota bacterium]|nr:exodeoxyribonuclease V subunit gamma [Myxococcota bacterium]